MKQQAPILTLKETMPPQMRGLLPHAAVRATAEHDMPSNVSAETRFGHDFSQVAVRPSSPVVSQDYSNVSCPLFPQRCPFGGACHTCPPRVQAKLKVGRAGDKYEQEANRVADQIMAVPAHSTVSCSPPRIQRFAGQATEELDTAPASVYRVLVSSGRPLGPVLRQNMEQRFGYDFSQVRVHSDAAAEQSARDIDAHAYTVGNDIVFGPGRSPSGTHVGQRLLAHELTHVVQQLGADGIRMGQSNGKRRPSSIHPFVDGGSIHPISRGNTRLSRNEIRDAGVPLPAGVPEAPETIPEQNIPQSEEPRQLITKNWAGEVLEEDQRRDLTELLYEDLGLTPGDTSESVRGATFLLHDTSGASSRTTIEHKAQNAIGPMGSGPNAFIPSSGVEIVQRPDFFDPNRVTTTEFEKGTDILDEAGREAAFREVWNHTATAQRTAAINRALTGVGLSASQITTISGGVESFLNGTNTGLTDGSKTAGAWTVREICNAVRSSGAIAVAQRGQGTDLSAACAAVEPLLADRRTRIGSTASVELVQVGSRDRNKSQNTCNPNNPNNLPLPNPPYSDNQYWNTTFLYLSAAVQAGRFPQITTHFAVDAFVGGHCDPRCFNLPKLYQSIATMLAPLGHGPASTYGIRPSFGLRSGTNNVWWHDTTCHSSHP